MAPRKENRVDIQNEMDKNLLQIVFEAEAGVADGEDLQEHEHAIEELCNRGANPCALNKVSLMSVESSALIMASALNLPELVRLMLKSPQALANPSAIDETGDTALHAAIWRGSLACFKQLLPLSDVDITNNLGRTPLMMALSDQEWEMFDALAPVSDLAIVDKRGMTALEQAEELSRLHSLPVWQRMAGILRATEESRKIELASSPSKSAGRAKSL